MRQQMVWQYSVRAHVILAITLCVAITGLSWWLLSSHQYSLLPLVAHWLVAVNLITFAYYGLDKFLARKLLWRIPEVTLYTLSALGGSPAALLAMGYFRHKTIKPSFRIVFWSIAVLQIVLTAYIVKLLWWS
jgi:uncharacterized membrane protein YsdA (DUF1294 family)